MAIQEALKKNDEIVIESLDRRQFNFIVCLTALFGEGTVAFVLRRLVQNAKVERAISVLVHQVSESNY